MFILEKDLAVVESTKQTLSFGPADSPAGILNDDGTLNNDASCLRLAEVAVAYARAGKPVTSLYSASQNMRLS